jgi:hypothetical protein
VLLNIFHLYRLAEPDEYEDEHGRLDVEWDRQCWWYKLAHVCRQWRDIILESPSRLDLHLFCANGVPVADMLTHSPPLPLTIDYRSNRGITAEDESGIFLALSHRDRVHRIWFWMLPNVEKFVTVMDDQFPLLELMYIRSRNEVALPVTFQAPNLRHLDLWAASLPIGSLLLTTATGLVTLQLRDIPRSAYFPPSYILTRLSLMVQLERLYIGFKSPIPNHDVERQSHQTPDTITLPNLRQFVFKGVSAYLEGLVARISAPSLNNLHVYLFHQLSFTVPRLLQFIQTYENLRFTAVQVAFSELAVYLYAVHLKDTPLWLEIKCRHLDWQVASAAQFCGTLSPILSVVEQVTFVYKEHKQSSEWHNDVDRRQWRELLRPFTNAKTIHVQDDDLVDKSFRSLPSDDGEPPLEILPNLEEVGYSGGTDAQDVLTAFVHERQAAGRPVNMVNLSLVDL